MNRRPTPADMAIMVALLAVFLVGCIKTGEIVYHWLAAIAAWVFP